MRVLKRRLLTTAVRDAIRAIPRPCEVGRAPRPAVQGEEPEMPYHIVYPIDGGGWVGAPGAPESIAEVWFQVTTVTDDPDAAEFNADTVRTKLLDMNTATGQFVTAITVSGMSILNRWSLGPPSFDLNEPRLPQVAERFAFLVSVV